MSLSEHFGTIWIPSSEVFHSPIFPWRLFLNRRYENESPRLMLHQTASSVGKMVGLPNCSLLPQFLNFPVAFVSNQNVKMNKRASFDNTFTAKEVFPAVNMDIKVLQSFFDSYFCGSPWFFLDYITQLRVCVFSISVLWKKYFCAPQGTRTLDRWTTNVRCTDWASGIVTNVCNNVSRCYCDWEGFPVFLGLILLPLTVIFS